MNIMEWMEKRRVFMKSNTNDEVKQRIIKLQNKLEALLDEVTKECKLIREKRQLLEGDRN
jgi:hypothetical protein